jgi:hypothetical protein
MVMTTVEIRKARIAARRPRGMDGHGFKIPLYPVHCVGCGWAGERSSGPMKPCPRCGGVVRWTY